MLGYDLVSLMGVLWIPLEAGAYSMEKSTSQEVGREGKDRRILKVERREYAKTLSNIIVCKYGSIVRNVL